MSENNQLVVIEKAKSREVFKTPGAIQAIIDEVKKKALLEAPDISTAKGRQAIASAAYKVAQTKTYIDKVGKEITDELKALPKIVDENRRIAREQLDQLKEEIRKPLTEWESEQEKIEAEKKASEEAAKLAEQIERDHELALLMNAEFDRRREEEARQAEEAKAAADKKHRATVNSAIVSALMSECGFSEGDAKKIVIAAAKGKLGKLIIDYWVAV